MANDLIKKTTCPLKGEDGRCKSPYRIEGMDCPPDHLKCGTYIGDREMERFRRYRVKERARG